MDEETRRIHRLLADGEISGPEADAILERVFARLGRKKERPLRTIGYWAGAALAAAAAVMLVVVLPRTPGGEVQIPESGTLGTGAPRRVSFLGGHARMTLPAELQSAEVPLDVRAVTTQLRHVSWLRNADASFRMLVHEGGYLQRADLPDVCRGPTPDVGQDGKLLLRSMVVIRGVPFCKIVTLAQGVVTLQIVGSIEGRTATFAFYFAEAERSRYEPAVEIAIRSFEHLPPRAGAPCTADEQARCIDDASMADCNDGVWRVRGCDELCKDLGGSDHGCLWEQQTSQIVCMCKNPP